MKRYRVREGSPLYYALMITLFLMVFIIIPGLGNHYIDGIY